MAIGVQASQAGTIVQLLSARERPAALAYLGRAPRDDLSLLELAANLGRKPAPSEVAVQMLGAWRAQRLVGLLSLRPSLMLDSQMEVDVLDLFVPHLASIETGLVKSVERVVDPLWERLAALGRRALIDRNETAYALLADESLLRDSPDHVRLRPARRADLDALVIAARASLREERRPDPFDGDPASFRRWVRGRLHRARVLELDGRVAFAGYADVRRSEGWLIQGVYTWPAARRRGVAALGMSDLVREAFESGAQHVQLAVIDGNVAATRLYESLGFRPFARLRTILFD